MKTRAAVAFQAGKPLEIVELALEGPKPGAAMKSYMSLSISQNAIVLSPTRLFFVRVVL